tara:strand:- start:479 stop:703 length:225 start_codon:yes stop_codon:yes gene_type:complete
VAVVVEMMKLDHLVQVTLHQQVHHKEVLVEQEMLADQVMVQLVVADLTQLEQMELVQQVEQAEQELQMILQDLQ